MRDFTPEWYEFKALGVEPRCNNCYYCKPWYSYKYLCHLTREEIKPANPDAYRRGKRPEFRRLDTYGCYEWIPSDMTRLLVRSRTPYKQALTPRIY